MSFRSAPKLLLRVAAVAMIASASGGCSSIPNWMNPFGDSDEPATASDDTAPQPATTQTADAGATPDLANVPDRPARNTTPDSEKQVVASLSADRSRAQYSADTLRGDAAAAAAPPAAPSPTDTTETASASDTAQTEPAPADTAADNGTTNSAPVASTQDTTASTETSTGNDASVVSPTKTAALPPPASSEAMASSSPVPSGRLPAVPATTPAPSPAFMASSATPVGSMDTRVAAYQGSATPAASSYPSTDAQLGFRPSSAPPLDASVAQFVAPAILNRYRQTATNGTSVTLASIAAPSSTTHRRRSRGGMGGPEQMTGSVVANLDTLSDPPAASSTSVYTNAGGMPPTSVVFFPSDTTVLSAGARAQVRAAVEAYRAKGGSGFIRVVGHASSRTGNMPLERHLVVIFEKSQQRANSVAQELIREGIPANKVLVEAVGDSEPVYYESMPKGEDGNRRAEIFLQS